MDLLGGSVDLETGQLAEELSLGQISEGIHRLLEGGCAGGKSLVAGIYQVLGGREGALVQGLVSGIEVGLAGLRLQGRIARS